MFSFSATLITPAIELVHTTKVILAKLEFLKYSIIFCAFVPAPDAKMAILIC